MSRRNKIIIIAVTAVVVLLIIMAIIWWLNQRGAPEPGINVNQPPTLEPKKLPTTPTLTGADEAVVGEPQIEATLKAVAITFAERFGSYSNQSNFQNFEDLQTLMTVRMKAWTDSLILQQTSDNAVFYGITTQALSAKIINLEESLGRAEVAVSTQRQESKGSTVNPRVFYQEILLKLVKTTEGWKVDEANWQ